MALIDEVKEARDQALKERRVSAERVLKQSIFMAARSGSKRFDLRDLQFLDPGVRKLLPEVAQKLADEEEGFRLVEVVIPAYSNYGRFERWLYQLAKPEPADTYHVLEWD